MTKVLFSALKKIVGVIAITLTFPSATLAENVLYSFTGGQDGGSPYAGLTIGPSGRLYGTASSGGSHGCGVVFQLVPNSIGAWTEKVLHGFGGSTADGCIPYAGVTIDAAGNLYGTTYSGGSNNAGVVFELQTGLSGTWNEKILHSFGANGMDGMNPYAGLVMDKVGNLYGTTYYGGSLGGVGTIFKLIRNSNGTWAEKILHSFNYTGGGEPRTGLIFDLKGNLYGTTQYGGPYQHGTVFRLSPTLRGGWSFGVLHSFNPTTGDGFEPYSGVTIDAAGNLYGTTLYGGYGWGTVYRLSVSAGKWRESIIHNFAYGNDGINPYGELIIDTAGNLYGTTWQSLFGSTGGAGIVFKLTRTSSATWSETVLFNFVNGGGGNPYSGVIFHKGILYGTTYAGGTGFGVVYKLAA